MAMMFMCINQSAICSSQIQLLIQMCNCNNSENNIATSKLCRKLPYIMWSKDVIYWQRHKMDVWNYGSNRAGLDASRSMEKIGARCYTGG